MLAITESVVVVWLSWSVLEMVLRGRSDSSVEEPSFPKSEFEKELLGTADVLTVLSEDCRRRPTTPTSRLIAPTVPGYLESGDGT